MPGIDYNGNPLEADSRREESDEAKAFSAARGEDMKVIEALTKATDTEMDNLNANIDRTITRSFDLPEGPATNNLEVVTQNQEPLTNLILDLQSQIAELTVEAKGSEKILGVKKKYWGWMLKGAGFLASVTASVLAAFAVKWIQNEKNSTNRDVEATRLAADTPAFPPFEPNLVSTVAANATLLISAPDSTFWSAMSSYVAAEKPVSVYEQLLWMNYTTDLAVGLMTAPFFWNNGNDKVALIQSATSSIQSNGLAATYAAAAGWTYNGQPIPRAVTASILTLAISGLITDMGFDS